MPRTNRDSAAGGTASSWTQPTEHVYVFCLQKQINRWCWIPKNNQVWYNRNLTERSIANRSHLQTLKKIQLHLKWQPKENSISKKPKGIYEASQIGWTISPRSKVRGEKFPKYLKFLFEVSPPKQTWKLLKNHNRLWKFKQIPWILVVQYPPAWGFPTTSWPKLLKLGMVIPPENRKLLKIGKQKPYLLGWNHHPSEVWTPPDAIQRPALWHSPSPAGWNSSTRDPAVRVDVYLHENHKTSTKCREIYNRPIDGMGYVL